MMDITILDLSSCEELLTLTGIDKATSIADVKRQFYHKKRSVHPDRMSFRTSPKGDPLKDYCTLESLDLGTRGKLYFMDSGPQIGWVTALLSDYAGPLVIYLLIYMRPALIYGAENVSAPRHPVVQIAGVCWTLHYAKRLFETAFVHRYSHSTMRLANVIKYWSYYWGMGAFVSYFMNHPRYTPPGNFSIHVALRNLRPAGSKERRIPYPTSNPMTLLFNLVSNPHYTYEVGAWVGFSIMTHSYAALLFTMLGFSQMTIWALNTHRIYKKVFSSYPRGRKAIIPFLL